MKSLLYIAGLYNVAFALFHGGSWKTLRWEYELSKLDVLNSASMQIFNVQTIYYLLFTAVVCFVFPRPLSETKLGKAFLIGAAGFWLVRAVQQFVFPMPDGATMFALTLVFLIGAALFAIPAFYGRKKGV